MKDGEPERARRPRPGVALAFAVAALASCWSGLSAPVAVVVAVCAAMLATRALRRQSVAADRRLAGVALGLSLVALAVAVAVLARTAGAISFELTGEPVVKGRTQAELDDLLTGAAERTRAERSRAAGDLDRLAPPPPAGGVPGRSGRAGGGTPAPPRR